MIILVLFGGTSSEREVSLRSGRAVYDALKKNGHEVINYDPIDGYEKLTDFAGRVDCVFPILHGEEGEDGKIQKKLEQLNLKYLGADSAVSKLCFNKIEFKKELNKLNILTPPAEIVTRQNISQSKLLKSPYVLKPIDGGSSVDTFIIINPRTQSYDCGIFEKYKSMLLEELIDGIEITVPVLGNIALPVIEIIPPEGGVFDYKNKYNGATQELCPPVNINVTKQKQAQELAETIHNKIGVRHLSRTDIIVDRDGRLWVLELNTIPGLTDQSLFPKAAQAAGFSFEELVQKFVELTLAE